MGETTLARKRSSLASVWLFDYPTTPFGKFSKIHHLESHGVACHPGVSCGKWKVEWKIWVAINHC